MNKLTPMEFKNQRIMTTKILSEQYGTDEKVLSNNFNRNSERFIEGKHYFKLQGEELKEFKGYLLNDESLKFVSVLILWTEKGALRHAKILETDEAWEVYEQLEETYFRVKDNKYLGLSKELQAIFALDNKTQVIENRIEHLENNMTIDYSQQEEIRTKATAKVVQELGGADAPAYKELNKKVFSSFWRDYKRNFDVNSYRNTSSLKFGQALEFINNWEPCREVELMIKGANSQGVA